MKPVREFEEFRVKLQKAQFEVGPKNWTTS